MVKIRDVAEAAGVSTATVSRVLADKPHVRSDVRQKVLSVVEALGYRPNRVAQNLRSNTSRTIALIISDIENPFFQRVSRAVDDAAHEMGYSVMFCNTDEQPEKERRSLELLQDENIAGVILAPTRQTIDDLTRKRLKMPMVIIDRRVTNSDVDNVLIDNVQAAYTLTKHLIDHGYTRISGIFGMSSTTGRDRLEGFQKALREQSLKPITELTKYANPREADGYATATRLLQLSQPPQAILTSNSLLAAGVMQAIREMGLAVPKDVAFVTFDDTTWAKLMLPPLTVIEQPTYEIGRTAAELLIKRIREPERSFREVILNTRLVIRQSCGCTP